jgi:serine/threonine protein kinase
LSLNRGQADVPDPWIGRVVDGRYRVEAQLGAGGMGVVYRVEHVRLGKVAAMKVLHEELASHPAAVRRFRREVELVSRLDHPHIVQTFDCGQTQGQLYLVMEYLRGEDLGTVVTREGSLPASRALNLCIQICAALEEAHERGIVHCDLKPENIVCARRRDLEHAKVLDFGLARLREGPERGEGTQTVVLGGTPGYMSPEQVQFEAVDARSDLYSLGATLYRLITGQAVFEANSPIEVMCRHVTDHLVLPSRRAPALGLPAAVDRVVARAMARRREDRYASAAEMREDLQAAFNLITGVTPARSSRSLATADSEPSLERLRRDDFDGFERGLRRRRLLGSFLAAPLVLGGLALGGWAATSLFHSRAASEEREPNDRPALASLLPRGLAVHGEVKEAYAGGQPDFDYFRVPSEPGTRVVTAGLTMDGEADAGLGLVLELFDQRGRLVGRADAASGAQAVGPLAIAAGEAYVRVRPVRLAGAQPAQPRRAPYRLSVDWMAPRPDWELEPNDTPEAATAVESSRTISGYLGSAEDRDWFRVRVPAGARLEGRVDGLDGLDLVVLLSEPATRVDRKGLGEHESFSVEPPPLQPGANVGGADDWVLVGIAAHPGGRFPLQPREDRDEPYTLKLRLRQGTPPAQGPPRRT